MTLSIFRIIFSILFFLAIVAFVSFVTFSLREINRKTDNIPKHHWCMGVYMKDIPQNEQNTAHLGSVTLKIYEKGEYSSFPVPRVGEEVAGVYYRGQDRFDMKGIVTSVYYNTDIDWIVVYCKCTEIRKNLNF